MVDSYQAGRGVPSPEDLAGEVCGGMNPRVVNIEKGR